MTEEPTRLPTDPARPTRAGDAVADLLRSVADGAGERARVVDLGGGTGGRAVALAERGHEVLVVDVSANALASATRRAAAAGVADLVRTVQADVTELGDHVTPASVDLVLCHGLLEVVDDTAATVAAAAVALRPGGALSIVAAGRLRAVLVRAMAGDLPRARRLLDLDAQTWDRATDGPRRFTADELVALAAAGGLDVERVDGVRVLSDLVPASLFESESERDLLADLEDVAGQDTRLREVAGALHVLARA